MNPLTVDTERLERLRALCLALPAASEKIAWRDPTWRVRDKIFAMQKGNFEGGRPSLWLKGAEGAQTTLIDADPELFFAPPYVGSKGWIGIYLDAPHLDWTILEDLIIESFRLIAPKTIAAQLEAPRAKPATSRRAKTTPRVKPATSPRAKPATRANAVRDRSPRTDAQRARRSKAKKARGRAS